MHVSSPLSCVILKSPSEWKCLQIYFLMSITLRIITLSFSQTKVSLSTPRARQCYLPELLSRSVPWRGRGGVRTWGQVLGQVGPGSVLPPASLKQVERSQQERRHSTTLVFASLCAYERSNSFLRHCWAGEGKRERERKGWGR